MTLHVDFERLNDYADGLLAPAARADVERHLDACEVCRDTLARLRRVLDAAGSVAREVAPGEDLWPALRAELEKGKEVRLASAEGGALSAERNPSSWRRHLRLAAAAVVLIVASSAVTVAVLRRPSPGGEASPDVAQRSALSAPPSALSGAQRSTLPASFVAAEQSYIRTADELTEALDAQRDRLSPETIAIVTRSLRLIDQAIAEAREALLRDPANQTIIDILSDNYQRKLELLRRAVSSS